MNKKDEEQINKIEKIKLVCRKCNNRWVIDRPKEHYVRYNKIGNFLVDMKTKEKKHFECESCYENRNIGRLRYLEGKKSNES